MRLVVCFPQVYNHLVMRKEVGAMTKDLTKGNIPKLLLGFLIPIIFGKLFQQIYSVVDAAIVGRSLGVTALGGVGSTGSLNFLILGFCDGVTSGFALPVAQAFGAGDHKALRRYVTNSAFLCVIITAILMVLVLPFTGKLLLLMGTPESQYDFAYGYIYVIFLGIPATMLYNMLAGIIRSLGDSKTPIYFLVIASILNIIGDLILINVFGMGVAGAAWATVGSQLISGVLCFFYMIRKFPILHMEKDDWKSEAKSVRFLLFNGLPMGFQFSITAIGGVILQSALNSLGPVYVSAQAAGQRINMLLITPFNAYLNVSSTFTGQNLGAGEFDRIKKGVLWGHVILTAFWFLESIGVTLLSDRMLLLFLTEEDIALVRDPAMLAIYCFTYGTFFLSTVQVVRLAIQGMSFSRLALIAGMLEMISRAGCGLFLVPRFGYPAACLAAAIGWFLADLFLIPAFIVCFRKRRAEYAARAAAAC